MSIATPDKELQDLERPVAAPQAAGPPPETHEDFGGEDEEKGEEVERGVSPVMTAFAAAASAAGAAWMVSSVFRDPLAHFVALGGVLIGIGVIIIAYRVAGARLVQYAAIPLALLVGVILIAPDARGGTINTPSLIADAIKAGGLLQPPISFDPGWRFILVVMFALLSSGAASFAIGMRRPKLGVLVPLPITLAAGLIQPDSSEITSAAVALVCGVLGMTLAYGAELGGDAKMSAAFESRRVLRGGAMALGLAVLVLGLSRFNVLFPQPDRNHVVPPQRPQVPPVEPDRTLFTYRVSNGKSVPLREGVIDVYSLKDQAWELPPYDLKRLKRITPPALVPAQRNPGKDAVSVRFTIADAHGHQLPGIGGLAEVTSSSKDVVDYDPRTQAIRLADKPVFNGYTYTVLTPTLPPDLGKRLASTGHAEKRLPGSDINDEFLVAPPPPNEVVTLLNQFSQLAIKQNVPEDPYNRMQFLRTEFYQKVVAAGPGKPVDLPASRVGQMLNGGDASPYEITAAEALLSRWAGVPSRIGYGYFGGDKQPDGSFAIRPKYGSTWLEAYFKGYGWIAFTGVPPKAKPSTSQQQKNEQNIQASNELALVVYVPVKYPTIQLLFEIVRYFLFRAALIMIPIIIAVICYPAGLKVLRKRRRRRWASRHGYPGRIAVAYAEFRDCARDLTIGNPAATPIEFLDHFVEDPGHEELAWLVSRALWGDLNRDLREDDAAAAERLSRSLRRRMRSAQSGLNVALALIARTSLKEPFAREMPNMWPKRRLRISNPLAGFYRRLRGGRAVRRRAATVGVSAMLSLLIAGCSLNAQATRRQLVPRLLVPASIGDLTFKRERSAEKQYHNAGPDVLVSDGRVYSIHYGDVIEGSLQLSLFKPEVDTSDINDESKSNFCIDNILDCPGHEAFMGFQSTLGTGRFHRVHVQGERTYSMVLSDQYIYCWFPPNTQTMVLLILRKQFTQPAGDLLRNALIAFESGKSTQPVPIPSESIPALGTLPSPGVGGPGGADLAPTVSPAPGASAGTSPTP